MQISNILKFNFWHAITYFIVCTFFSVFLLDYFVESEASLDALFGLVFYGLILLLVKIKYNIVIKFFKIRTKIKAYIDILGLTGILITSSILMAFYILYISKYFSIDLIVGLYSDLDMYHQTDGSYFLWQNIIIFLSISILTPVVEELFFRGLLIDLLYRKFTKYSSVILSSIVFAILHVDLLGALIFGIILGFIYIRTESLSIPIFIHIANNTIVSIIAAIDEMGIYDIEKEINHLFAANSLIFLLLTSVLLLISYFFLFISYKKFVSIYSVDAEKSRI